MTKSFKESPAMSIRSRSIACLMALVLAISGLAFSSCATSSANETVKLLIKVPRTGHDVVFDDSITQVHEVIQKMADGFKSSYSKYPIDIEIEVFEQTQYDENVQDSFDTGKSPDILYGDYFNMSTYIHSGRVIPLNEVITSEISEDIYEYLWDLSSIDGKVYMMPYLARQNVLAYNKELFSKAGLEEYIKDNEISSWTKDQWTEILDTLAAKLPEHIYPMMMYAASSQGDTHTMTLLRSAGSDFFDESGHFNLSTKEGIEALAWIQQGVGKGWFPPHSENLEIEDCSSLFREGQLAIYMVNNASVGRYGDTIGLVNFPGSGEEGCATTFVSGFEIFDNGDEKKMQVAKDFLSYVYSNEEMMSYSAGTLPASKSVSEKYGSEIQDFDLFSDNRKNVVDFSGNNPDTRAVREVFYLVIHDLLMGNITPKEAATSIDAQCNKAIDEGTASSKLHE